MLEDASHNLSLDPKFKKLAEYYASGMDTVAIEQRGYQPIKADLDRINNLKTTKDVINDQIDKKSIAVVLSKFTFSMFSKTKIKQVLDSFGFPSTDKENELRGFDNYIFLAHYEKCYEYEKGLIESQFDATENFIL